MFQCSASTFFSSVCSFFTSLWLTILFYAIGSSFIYLSPYSTAFSSFTYLSSDFKGLSSFIYFSSDFTALYSFFTIFDALACYNYLCFSSFIWLCTSYNTLSLLFALTWLYLCQSSVLMSGLMKTPPFQIPFFNYSLFLLNKVPVPSCFPAIQQPSYILPFEKPNLPKPYFLP